jgi:hypothetical protein
MVTERQDGEPRANTLGLVSEDEATGKTARIYTSMIQGMAGIVYPGMSREEWTAPVSNN